MINDMTAALDSLRHFVPDMDRAWYAAQRGEDENEAADALASDARAVLTALAAEAVPEIKALGLDPNDRQSLRYADDNPAVAFHLQCYECIETFRHWAAEGDFLAQLELVELAAHRWLGNGHVIAPEAAELRAAKAQAAISELNRRAQQSGNTRKRSTAKARKADAWAVFGLDGPNGKSLIARLKTATPEQLAQLAGVYGYDDDGAFLADAMNLDSATRKKLVRDNQK